MNFIDTHVHLQDFKDDYIKDVINSALGAGVSRFLCVSSKPDEWQKLADLAEKHPNLIVPAFGLHPWYVQESGEDWAENLQEMLQKHPKAIVGEIGLDGYKAPDRQVEVFERQLLIAREFNRPVVVHALKSQNWFEQNWRLLPEKFVFHSYNGKKEFLKEIISHNGYVSFSFSILKNKELAELVDMVPPHKLLLETDSPYQGVDKETENEPAKLPLLAAEIARIKEDNLKAFAEQVYNNSLEFIKVG